MRAIVTGASSGIGQAIYNHLKESGYEAEGISRRGPDTFVDYSIEEAGYFARCKPGDVLVLNHGILSFEEIKDLEKLVTTNLTSYYHILQFQAQEGRPVSPGGLIILVASVSGVKGEPEIPLYAALKAGVINLTKSYALKLQMLPGGKNDPPYSSVRVNCISPGFFKTNLVPGETPPDLLEKVPMRREAQVGEILPVIDFLIQAKYVTGQNIIIDGGLSL